MPVVQGEEQSSPDEIYNAPVEPVDVNLLFAPPEVKVEEKVESKPEEKLPEFSPRYRDDFEGMLYLGRLESTFKLFGHKIKIQTLDQNKYLEVGELVKKYEGNWQDTRSKVSGMVAACLVSIDGKKGWNPPVFDSELEEKFRWVLTLSPFIIDAIYEKFNILESKVEEILLEMGKASGAKLPPGSTPNSGLPNEEVVSQVI